MRPVKSRACAKIGRIRAEFCRCRSVPFGWRQRARGGEECEVGRNGALAAGYRKRSYSASSWRLSEAGAYLKRPHRLGRQTSRCEQDGPSTWELSATRTRLRRPGHAHEIREVRKWPMNFSEARKFRM